MALEFVTRLVDGASGPANRAAAAISRLRQQMRALTQTTRDASAEFDRSAARWRSASGQFVAGADRSINAAGLLQKAIMGVGAAAAGAAIYGGAKLGGTILDSAIFREKSVARLSALLGSKERGDKEFIDAIKIAEKTPYEPEDVVNSLAKLAITFKDDDQRRELFGAISDFTTNVGGGDKEVMAQVIKGVSDIAGKGKLEMEELKGQLAEAGLGLDRTLPEIAKLLGIQNAETAQAADQVRKAISAGKVSGEMGVFAVYKALMAAGGSKGRAGSATEASSGTFAGIISNIKGGLDTLLLQADTTQWPGMTALKDLLSDIAGLFSSSSKEGQGMVNMIKRLADTFTPVFRMMQADLKATSADFGNATDESERFYAGLEALWIGMYGVAKAVAYVGGAISSAMGWILEGFVAVNEWFDGIKARIQGFGDDMEQAGRNIVTGLVKGMADAAGNVYDAAAGLGADVLLAVKRSLGIASPSRETFKLGGFTAEGFEEGIASRMGNVRGQAQEMAGQALAGAGRGGGAGPISINLGGVTVYTSGGGDPQAIGEEVRTQVGAVFRDMLDQALERMAQEA